MVTKRLRREAARPMTGPWEDHELQAAGLMEEPFPDPPVPPEGLPEGFSGRREDGLLVVVCVVCGQEVGRYMEAAPAEIIRRETAAHEAYNKCCPGI
jgi:hypothetical protein